MLSVEWGESGVLFKAKESVGEAPNHKLPVVNK